MLPPSAIAGSDRSSLQRVNLAAAALHLALAVTAFVTVLHRTSIQAPAFWGTAEWNRTACALAGYDAPVCPVVHGCQQTATGGCVSRPPAVRKSMQVDFSWVLICSQAITAVGHLLVLLFLRVDGGWYVRWVLRHGIKLWTWAEYALTAALTNHVLLYYAGQLDVRAHLLGYAAQSSLMAVGLAQDLLRAWARSAPADAGVCRAAVGGLFAIGFFNLLSVWYPGLHVLWFDTPRDQNPPAFVKWVVLAEFLLYASFGFAQLAFFAPFLLYSNDFRPRFHTEQLVQVVLSFAAKAVLNVAFSACFVYGACGD